MKHLMKTVAAAAILGALACASGAEAASSLASLQYGYVPPVGNTIAGLQRNVTISSSINPLASSRVATTIIIHDAQKAACFTAACLSAR